jgi:hypothetical protein
MAPRKRRSEPTAAPADTPISADTPADTSVPLSGPSESLQVAKPLPANKRYPTVDWRTRDRDLNSRIWTVLGEYDSIRKVLYPRRNDTVSGSTKTTAFRLLAARVFHGTHFEQYVQNDPAATNFYASSLKNRLVKMEAGFKEAKTILGVTGGGLDHEEEIWEGPAGDYIRGKWEEAKQRCPWFFEMKPIIGLDRFDDDSIAIGNSTHDVGIDIMSRGRPEADQIPPVDGVSDADGISDNDIQEESQMIAEEVALREDFDSISSQFNISQTSPQRRVVNSPALPTSLSSSHRIASNRRSSSRGGQAGVLGELGESLRQLGVLKNNRKRAVVSAVEETRRMEINQKYELERLKIRTNQELELRRLALQEREIRLREHAAGISTVTTPSDWSEAIEDTTGSLEYREAVDC